MSKIRCICDNVIEMISVPNVLGFWIISEQSIDELEMSHDDAVATVFDELNDRAIQGYRCNECGRLILFEKGRSGSVTFYKKEEI